MGKAKYPDGQEVMLNDKIALGSDSEGTVICLITEGKYRDEEAKAWGYLKSGVIVDTTSYGIIHYHDDCLDSDMRLLERG